MLHLLYMCAHNKAFKSALKYKANTSTIESMSDTI